MQTNSRGKLEGTLFSAEGNNVTYKEYRNSPMTGYPPGSIINVFNLPKVQTHVVFGSSRTASQNTTVTYCVDTEANDLMNTMVTNKLTALTREDGSMPPSDTLVCLHISGLSNTPFINGAAGTPRPPNLNYEADDATTKITGVSWSTNDYGSTHEVFFNNATTKDERVFLFGLVAQAKRAGHTYPYIVMKPTKVTMATAATFARIFPAAYAFYKLAETNNEEGVVDHTEIEVSIFDMIANRFDNSTSAFANKVIFVIMEAGAAITEAVCPTKGCYCSVVLNENGVHECKGCGQVQPDIVSKPTATVRIDTADNDHTRANKSIVADITIRSGQEYEYLGLTMADLDKLEIADVDPLRDSLVGNKYRGRMIVNKYSISVVNVKKI
jgi:hypothetical protein